MTSAGKSGLRAVLARLAGMLTFWTGFGPGRHAGPVSDHFDGRRFFNPGRPQTTTLLDVLRWRLTRRPEPWPFFRELPTDRPPRRVEGDGLRVCYVGQSTVLIQTQGLNILTDPFWADRASPVSWLGPRRVHPPGIAFADLPAIDLVLVSHNHYDHLDLPTLRRIWQRDRPRILTPLGNDRLILDAAPEAAVEARDWGDEVRIAPGLSVALAPMQHWSARSPFDRNRALWAAFVLRTPAGALYMVGDSGYGNGEYFREAARRYGPFRLAILPIGSSDPAWFMAYAHMSPADAVRAWRDLGRPPVLPIHHHTIQLADTGYDQPFAALRKSLRQDAISEERFCLLLPGGHWWVDPPTAATSCTPTASSCVS